MLCLARRFWTQSITNTYRKIFLFCALTIGLSANIRADDNASDSFITGKRPVNSHDDATWILTSAFIIFTMQSGFGLLESGTVTPKNEVNIMVKNAADVIFGGVTYWMFGYAFSFGDDVVKSNRFSGWGNFFVMTNASDMGMVYSKFFFQASFATTATTIVSGAMAERIKLEAYILFSILNTLVFCFPAHWVWGETGWLRLLGVIDIAGAGPVHLVGGVTGLIATLMLKPRHGRYNSKHAPQMGSPTNAILGLFMLWWGWLGFNCGSTFGISGEKWKLAARSAVSTITASMAGGMVAMFLSYVMKKRQFDIPYLINGILGSLVGITAFCALAHPWEGFVIGMVGSIIAVFADIVLNKLKIDDPVGVVPVHCMGSIWSLLAVGLFARKDSYSQALAIDTNATGIFYGSSFRQLGVQTLAVVAIGTWTVVTSFLFLKGIDMAIGLRVSLVHEILGADIVEHSLGDVVYDKVSQKVVSIGTERFMENTREKEIISGIVHHSPNFTMRRNGAVRRGSTSSGLSVRSVSTVSIRRRNSGVYGKHYTSHFSNEDIEDIFFNLQGAKQVDRAHVPSSPDRLTSISSTSRSSSALPFTQRIRAHPPIASPERSNTSRTSPTALLFNNRFIDRPPVSPERLTTISSNSRNSPTSLSFNNLSFVDDAAERDSGRFLALLTRSDESNTVSNDGNSQDV